MCDITTIKDVIVALAAATGAVVGVVGLSTWRRQLVGTANHELSTKLRRAAIATRNAITEARSEGIYLFEFPDADASEKNEAEHAEKLATIYEKRWLSVQSAAADIEVLIPDAEAAFGVEVVEAASGLLKLVEKLRFAFHEYVQELRRPGHWQTLGESRQKNTFAVLFAKGEDEYGGAVEGAMKQLHTALAKKR